MCDYFNSEEYKTYKKIIDHFGVNSQIIVAIEELSELQKELLKGLRYSPEERLNNITEEMADVEIMLDQLKIIFNNGTDVEIVKESKIRRTVERYLK